jgi:cold shock CspA family protein
MNTQTGTVKWLNQRYGLAFIDPDHSAQAVFVVLKDLDNLLEVSSLMIGQKVRYVARQCIHGPRAQAVDKLDQDQAK